VANRIRPWLASTHRAKGPGRALGVGTGDTPAMVKVPRAGEPSLDQRARVSMAIPQAKARARASTLGRLEREAFKQRRGESG